MVQLHSKLFLTVPDILQTSTGAQGSYSYTRDPSHCSRDKHLERPNTKQKEVEGNYIPAIPGLLTKK